MSFNREYYMAVFSSLSARKWTYTGVKDNVVPAPKHYTMQAHGDLKAKLYLTQPYPTVAKIFPFGTSQ
jgi:hypothetical protein